MPLYCAPSRPNNSSLLMPGHCKSSLWRLPQNTLGAQNPNHTRRQATTHLPGGLTNFTVYGMLDHSTALPLESYILILTIPPHPLEPCSCASAFTPFRSGFGTIQDMTTLRSKCFRSIIIKHWVCAVVIIIPFFLGDIVECIYFRLAIAMVVCYTYVDCSIF
jgi:hypothetical protein